MSAYMTLPTPMIDEECLIAALADMGFDHTRLEMNPTPLHLHGYQGDSRSQTGHIVIPRRYVGAASNDIGFYQRPTGYQVIVSNYDRITYGPEWLSRLHSRYQHHAQLKQERLDAVERQRQEEARQKLVEAQRAAVTEKAKKLGYMVKESREGEVIRLQLVKRSY